jgi:hypothetical protein
MRKFLALNILALTAILVSCGDFEGEIVKDNLPEIPVTYEGATTVGFNPYYTVVFGTGNTPFSITLRIPDDSRLKIREVSKIVAGATSINVGSLSNNAGSYFTTPVAVNGNTYTLSTSITEFNTKVASGDRITAAPAAGAFTERAMMIRLIMDDNSTIVPVQVRIRVVR